MFSGEGRRLESAIAMSYCSAFTLPKASVAAISAAYPEVLQLNALVDADHLAFFRKQIFRVLLKY
jgi:hypothetical protein